MEHSDIDCLKKPGGTIVLEKLGLARQSKTFEHPGPPPDGGWIAWRQVLGGFLVVTLCWGLINTFGFFQTYYTSLPHINASASDISWIGSIQVFLLMFVGAYSGSASDAGYYRLTSFAGAFLFVFGVFMTSISTKYYQLLLAHGFCVGLGNGLIFIPTMSVVATYFSPKRKSLAIGSILCGSAVGGIVFPLMFDRLLPRVGFGWSLRIFGFIAIVLFTCSQLLLKKRLPPKDGGKILDFEALKDKVFVLFVLASFINFLGVYFAFFFIAAYARDILGLSFTKATNILLVINGAGIPGRLIPLWLADQRQWRGIRPITVQIPVNLIVAALFFAWIGVKTEKSAYIFAAFYGFVGNAIQSLFPANLADMTLDPRRTGSQVGWGFTIGSFSGLIGVPISSVLVQADDGAYLYAQIYAGICALCGFCIIIVVAWLRLRRQEQVECVG